MNNFNKFVRAGMPEHILYELVSSFPEAAHLKDIKTKKYIYTNKNNLKIYGLNDPNSIIGLTVNDLDGFMKPYWGNNFAQNVNTLDIRVSKEVSVLVDTNRTFLDKFGLVHIQNMTKAPVVNTLNKVTVIFTMSFDITEKLDKFYIFNIYKKIYLKKRQACNYFMDYLKITEFFKEILSEKEMLCFIFMLENKSYKYISNKMNISIKTTETHICNITNKTKGKNLSEILEFLRIRKNAREI